MYSNRIMPSDRVRPRRNAGERLRRALERLSEGQGCVLRHQETDWTSINFAGTRHTIDLRFEGDDGIAAGEEFITILPDHEFAIPGQLVIEAQIREVDHRLRPPLMLVSCEMLLLEDA